VTHTELDELYELFVMAALEAEAAAEIEQHLREGCVHCTEGVREAFRLTALMSGIAEPAEPSAQLRRRILSSVSPLPREAEPKLAPAKRSSSWFFAIAALAACLALIIFSLNTRSEVQRLRDELRSTLNERDQLRTALANATTSEHAQLAVLTGERDQLRSALAIIRRPDSRSTRFGTTTSPHGWVFTDRNGGLVVVGSQLPQVANDRTLELWLVPRTGAPRPAGLFRATDAAGDIVQVSTLPVDPSQIKAIAMSNEPRVGSSAPTTTPFLLVPLG
jgi:anti-sigma-K factor RskA